jgi:hypothetical protein
MPYSRTKFVVSGFGAIIEVQPSHEPVERPMDPELVDRIYESSFVPELWPGVLDELGRIAEGIGGALFIAKGEVHYWTASPASIERTRNFVDEGWFWRGKMAARLFAARHSGFLIDIDFFTPDELDLEPLYRDFWRPQGIGFVVGTAIPIPTGENVCIAMPRRTERGPAERNIVQKLDELRPISPAAH